MKKRHRLRKVLLALAALLLTGVIVFGGVCLKLARTDNLRDKYTLDKTEDGFLLTVLKSAVFGQDFTVTEDQLNTYLNKTFCTPDKPLRNIRLYFHENRPSEVYGKVNYHHYDYAFRAGISTHLNSQEGIVTVRLTDVHLGELAVHDMVIQSLLRDFADKNENVQYADGVLYVRTRYDYQLDEASFTLRLERFEPAEGAVICKTNNLTWELLKAVKAYLFSEKGRELLGRLMGQS